MKWYNCTIHEPLYKHALNSGQIKTSLMVPR